MPRVIDPAGNEARSKRAKALNVDYKYKYPDGLKFKPGEPLHDTLAKEVYNRARESRERMEARFGQWDLVNHSLTAYVPLSEDEEKVREADDRKPVSIVIPVTFAALETLLAYFVSTFLQEPIFRYYPVGPEDTVGTALMEITVNQQLRKTKVALALHTLWRDGFAYGIGAAVNGWKVRRGFKTRRSTENEFSHLLKKFVPSLISYNQEEVIQYEANTLNNIDPYNFLPDPNCSIEDVESMEYVGWIDRDNLMSLLSEENSEDPDYFNVKYVKDLSDRKSNLFRVKSKSRGSRWNIDEPADMYSNPCDVIHLFWDLIPSEWDLSDGEYPETWKFALAADGILIQAYPVRNDHARKPVVVFAPEFDGHTGTPISRLEVVHGMQETIDWFFSSHIHNARKSINNITIVDPYLVNYSDVIDPKPGGVWRLRRAAWGRGVDNVAKQFQMTDITKGHVQDAMLLVDMLNRVTATTDPMQGIMRSGGERRSATEARGAYTGGMTRLARLAAIAGYQVHDDLALMFASNTGQYMEKDTYVRLIGRWEEELAVEYGQAKATIVSPSDLDTHFDIEGHDATFPLAENGDLWVQLFQIVASQPLLMQKLDIYRIFKHIARILGAKNLSEFEIKSQVVPDEQVADQAQQGDIVPMEELSGIQD